MQTPKRSNDNDENQIDLTASFNRAVHDTSQMMQRERERKRKNIEEQKEEEDEEEKKANIHVYS